MHVFLCVSAIVWCSWFESQHVSQTLGENASQERTSFEEGTSFKQEFLPHSQIIAISFLFFKRFWESWVEK